MKRLANSMVQSSTKILGLSGQGTIDFGATSNKLLEIGYTRPCLLEIVFPGGTVGCFRVSKTALEELGWQT